MKSITAAAAASLAVAALTLAGCSSSPADSAPAKAPASPSSQAPSAAPSAPQQDGMDEGSSAMEHIHPIGDGTSPQAGPYLLEVVTVPAAGEEGDLVLSVTGEEGPVTDFAVAHTKKMHLLLTPEDLSTVVHAHPEPQQDGTWKVPVTLPSGGAWRVVADVSQETDAGELQPFIMGAQVTVPGPAAAQVPVPEPTDTVEADGFSIALQGDLSASDHGTLMVTVTKDGKMVDLEDYMGSQAHLIAFNTRTFAYAHQHPAGGHDHEAHGDDGHGDDGHGDDGHGDMENMGSMLHFETEFPEEGTYVFFLQFQVDGKVHTASFTADVA